MATQKFTLVENALDSLEHAISHLNNMAKVSTVGAFKRIILDLSHVAELLFKERLRQIHPAFVLYDIDKYPSMIAHTVTAADALKRLQRIASVEFSDSDRSALKTIREKRNEIEHYALSIDDAEAKVVIGRVLAFIFRFATDEVGLDWADRRINDPAWKRLNQFAEFYEIEKARVLAVLEDRDIATLECPICSNETFDMEAEVCMLCGHSESVLECGTCKADYLYSNVEYEDAGLCRKCEWEDGYATAHCEKY